MAAIEMRSVGGIKLLLGPMFAGKSSYLLAEERKSRIAKKSVVCVKHSFDTRYTQGTEIVTHNRDTSTAPSYAVNTLGEIRSVLETYDVILIDEGQFFGDLVEVVTSLQEKYIVIAALSGDFKQESFHSIATLIPKADQIIHLCAICTRCGKDAPFTARLIKTSEQTLVGGSELYEPRCRACFE